MARETGETEAPLDGSRGLGPLGGPHSQLRLLAACKDRIEWIHEHVKGWAEGRSSKAEEESPGTVAGDFDSWVWIF